MTTERVDLTIARALTDWRSKRPYDRSGVMASRGFYGGFDAARRHYQQTSAHSLRVGAEALNEFRKKLVAEQLHNYGVVLPDVSAVIDDLATEVDSLISRAQEMEEGDDA